MVNLAQPALNLKESKAMSIKISGLMCDKCRILIKYTSDITEEDKGTDFHLCERCNPDANKRQDPVKQQDPVVQKRTGRGSKKQ